MATWRERAAGKWQIPLLLLSLATLAASIHFSNPRGVRVPLSEGVTQLEALTVAGADSHALELGERLLARKDCTGSERAAVELCMARAQFSHASRRGCSVSAGRGVVDRFRAAQTGGAEVASTDLAHLGEALEWQGQFSAAIEYFDQAMAAGLPDPWDLQRHIIRTLVRRLEAKPEDIHARLAALLKELPDSRLDLRFWALEEQLAVQEELDRLDQCATLLAENADRFRETDFQSRFEFLGAFHLYKVGEFDEAQRRLRSLRNAVEPTDAINAMTGWLLGRVALSDGGPQRPQEALSFFHDVVRNHSRGPYTVASRLGQAEALAMLERTDEAAVAYQLVLDELESVEDPRVVNRAAVAVSLGVAAETQRRNGRLHAALAYARLALPLVDKRRIEHASAQLQQFAEIAVQLAEEFPSADAALQTDAPTRSQTELLAEAAGAYLELAKVNTLNERRSSEASWSAAETYSKAGKTADAVRLFEAFIAERPADTLVPRAWLRIGQLRQNARQLNAAVVAYQECYRRFPRTLDGARALVPLARCHGSLGGDHLELAEKTLRIVLEESEIFTPEAPEFSDALFLLGDVLARRGAFERAISAVDEALQRYPQDPRAVHARGVLADAYRQSGLALREEIGEASFDGEIAALRAESTSRLTTARELYRRVITEYEARNPASLQRLDQMLLRHAYLYEADCYFEMQEYARALKLYEEAAGNYKDVPSGLAASVQIIHCHVFLGQAEEARAALARAMVLTAAMPERAFEVSISPEARSDWVQYLEWLGESGLF